MKDNNQRKMADEQKKKHADHPYPKGILRSLLLI